VKVLKEVEAALLSLAAAQLSSAEAQQPQAQLQWAVQQLLPCEAYQLQQVSRLIIAWQFTNHDSHRMYCLQMGKLVS
jgi:hypothetical protein